MSRIRSSVVLVLSAAVVAAATAPACADNDMSIFVHGMMAPPAARTAAGCTYIADPTSSQLLFSGTMDAALTPGYTGVLLVGNQMIPRGDPNNTRAESNRVHLQGAIVKVQDPNGDVISEFTSTAVNGLINPQNNNAPGFTLIGVTLIDLATGQRIADPLPDGGSRRVEAHVKVFGRTLGGVDVESGEWFVPITVCKGCLVDFSQNTDPVMQPVPNCRRASTTTTVNPPCAFGQDERVPCTSCIGLRICNPGAP